MAAAPASRPGCSRARREQVCRNLNRVTRSAQSRIRAESPVPRNSQATTKPGHEVPEQQPVAALEVGVRLGAALGGHGGDVGLGGGFGIERRRLLRADWRGRDRENGDHEQRGCGQASHRHGVLQRSLSSMTPYGGEVGELARLVPPRRRGLLLGWRPLPDHQSDEQHAEADQESTPPIQDALSSRAEPSGAQWARRQRRAVREEQEERLKTPYAEKRDPLPDLPAAPCRRTYQPAFSPRSAKSLMSAMTP